MTLDNHNENNPRAVSFQSLHTAKDVAAALGISAKTVHKLVREKKLACVQVTACGRWLVHGQVLDYDLRRTCFHVPPTENERIVSLCESNPIRNRSWYE